MAAADDEEGQSENKKDEISTNARVKQFSTMQQEFDNKLRKRDCTYENQVGLILSGWERLTCTVSDSHVSFAHFLYRWTLRLILQGEWPKLEKIVKTRLGATLQRCTRDPALKPMITKLHPLVSDPWGSPILKAIISSDPVQQTDVVSYIGQESWEIIRVRVETLVESKCEPLASALLQACLSCLPSKGNESRSEIPLLSEEDHHYFIDLHLVLMYKSSKKKFLEKVKQMETEEGVAFVQRLLSKDEKVKLWKYKLKISNLAIQIFLASCIVKTCDETYRVVFRQWCMVMKANNEVAEVLTEMVRKYIQLAESAQHIYVMGSVLHEMWDKQHAALVTELLIRALTLDMNSVERAKLKGDDNSDTKEHIKHEHQMALGFMNLASLFDEHCTVARECVLTAFSLHPTDDRLSRIKRFAVRRNELESSDGKKTQMKIVQEECKDENSKIDSANSMDSFVAETEGLIEQLHVHTNNRHSSHADILTAPQEVLDAKSLGLSKELCDDLAVVVSSPRWQVLSWMLKPKELVSICEKYLHDADSAKNITKELKYLNIDYNQFRHLPSNEVDEFTGIEKGYEHFMVDSDEDQFEDSTVYTSSSEDEVSHLPKSRRMQAKVSRGSSGSSTTASDCEYSVCKVKKPSETDDTDSEYLGQTGVVCTKGFEGKRVTSVSYLDPPKRLRVDPAGHLSTFKNNELGELRLYRHQKAHPCTNASTHQTVPSCHFPSNRPTLTQQSLSTNPVSSASSSILSSGDIWKAAFKNRRLHYPDAKTMSSSRIHKPDLKKSSHNLLYPRATEAISTKIKDVKSSPTLASFNGSMLKAHLQGLVKAEKTSNKPTYNRKIISVPAASSRDSIIKVPSNNSWKYSGYVIAGKPETTTTNSPSTNPVSCTYKTKSGKLVDICQPINKPFLKKMLSERNSQDESLPKAQIYLGKKDKIPKKQLEMYPSRTSRELALAQMDVFNEIMSPEHRKRLTLPQMIETIAMPVSHTPPNLPPSDKTSPAGLSRVLPKGTIVVRKPICESDAGPSGVPRTSVAMSVMSHPTETLGRNAVSITARRAANPAEGFAQESADSSRRSTVRFQSVETTITGNNFQRTAQSPPLTAATVGDSISTISSQRFSPPDEILGGSSVLNFTSNRSSEMSAGLDSATLARTTTTVASIGGESRGTSMLESLLRDRGTPSNPTLLSNASTATTTALHEPLVAPSANAGINNSLSVSSGSPTVVTSMSASFLNRIACDSRSVAVGADSLGSLHTTGTEVSGGSAMSSTPSSVASSPTLSRSVGTGSPANLIQPSISSSTPNSLHQLVLPAQFIQVQGSDGSTGLGIVHSGSLDLRLPPGTRVIKSSGAAAAQQNNITASQAQPRQLNVLHNLKIVHQNRSIVRTVLVPPSSGIPSLSSQQSTQLVSINPNAVSSVDPDNTVSANKIQQTQLQKLLGHNVVPGGLVIRAMRPSASGGDAPQLNSPVRPAVRAPSEAKQNEIKTEDSQEEYKMRSVPYSSHCEGLGERLNRHFLKTALVTSTSTQSVGTQTQTTAVKPVTGQIVSQVLMNPLKVTNSTSAMTNLPVVSHVGPGPSRDIPPPLNLTAANSVSSETLEQLREFESVFEKVSNKSGKENEVDICPQNFPNTSVSSEESMIAAQLLSMANDTPLSNSSTYICSMPVKTPDVATTTTVCSPIVATISTSIANVTPSHLPEGTLINTQTGTLILVNPSNVSNAAAVQPPPADSPGLSSTSSHSSVASSPSSTTSRSKKHGSKPKAVPAPVTTPPKPKSPPPPPPKAPPKPAVAKPQVEESDEIKARIQSILDQYKQDLANTPQPQPAPRNRKNCPPPKTEGKSSGKKKSQVKKLEGTSTASPASVEGGHLPSVSSSPAALSTPTHGEDSDGSGAGSSTSNRFSSNTEDKALQEDPSPPIVQSVVMPNVKGEGTTTVGTLTSLPQALAGSRVFQLVRHGGKVAAIPASQSYHKLKSSLATGSGPPNVTIQGRISVSDLMEGHLSSIISGATGATVTPSSSLIAKLLQPQQAGGIQQIVIQPSRQQAEQIIQQVAIPHIVQTPKAETSEGELTMEQGRTAKPQHPGNSANVAASPQSINSASSPFPNIEEDTSNSSEPSQDEGRLPPFFTLTKPFMVPPSEKQRGKSQSADRKTPNDSREQMCEGKHSGASRFLVADMQCDKAGLQTNRDSSGVDNVSQNHPGVSEGSAMGARAATEVRQVSFDSARNDIGSEEVQIPPSPATLTKQLQNAYMTEAALSPAISQSQLSSSSSYSPPATVQELQFLDANSESQNYSPALNRYSTAGPSGESSSINTSTSNGISNAALACLSSPSGDVYLDQAGVGLGLDSLPLGEDHAQSPSLSDLVPAVPLLSWSPRSADSLMEQSPSFNHTIAGDMNLDTQHSEDSLCDSSTAFPVLFSIEPDAASISSNVSEELNLTRIASSSSSGMFVSSGLHTSTSSVALRSSYTTSSRGALITSQSREQDQTVSSTRIENQMNNSPSMPLIEGQNTDSKDGETTDSDSLSWQHGNEPTFLDRNPPVHTYHRRDVSSRRQSRRSSSKIADNTECRRSPRQSTSCEKTEEKPVIIQNGLIKEDNREPLSQRTTRSRRLIAHGEVTSPDLKIEALGSAMPKQEDTKRIRSHYKLDGGGESCQRFTRGSKRRSEGSVNEEKRGKSFPPKFEPVKFEDDAKSPEDAEVAHFSKSLRGRHISGTSDSSSNFSTDRVSTPGPQDSPNANGGSLVRKRKRRNSPASSASSRDCSPISSLHLAPDGGGPSTPTVLHTRRSSSREQSKKTRCACCVDESQISTAHTPPGRRVSSRGTRATPPT